MKTPHYTSSSRVCSWSRFQVTHQLLHTLGAAHERRFIFYVSKEKLFIAKKRNWKEFDNCAVEMGLGMWWQTELKCWNQIWTNESPRYTIIVCPCYVWWFGMQSKSLAFAEEFTFFSSGKWDNTYLVWLRQGYDPCLLKSMWALFINKEPYNF